jgi:hypothetical protein
MFARTIETGAFIIDDARTPIGGVELEREREREREREGETNVCVRRIPRNVPLELFHADDIRAHVS